MYSEAIVEFARDPEFLNRDKTWMKLYVKFKHLPNEIMFTACIDSDIPYVRTLFKSAIEGNYGEVKEVDYFDAIG